MNPPVGILLFVSPTAMLSFIARILFNIPVITIQVTIQRINDQYEAAKGY